ncbi:MAG: hypothetical protein HZB61_11160 [Nitrospirae bacterium]|nr:hypothetical protein [Nitrospirota bacterium]
MMRRLIILLLSAFVLAGCAQVSGYLGFLQRHKSVENAFQNQQRVELLMELSPEDCFRLQGYLAFSSQRDTPLLSVIVSNRFGKDEVVVARELVIGIPFYTVFVPEGEYTLFFFADLDRNGTFDSHELVGQTSPDDPVRVAAGLTKDSFTVEGPKVAIDFDRPRVSAFPLQIKVTHRTYIYDSLRDDFFDARYGQVGLYQPTALITHTQGFFFGLEEYDARKIQVLFVHGVGGTPQDWKFIIDGMDRARFQPWFFYYPSGLPLEKLGSLLARIIIDINKSIVNNRLIIVAHSMGGLVAQDAINKLCRDGTPEYLKMYISFSTPYGGVGGAKTGVEYAPLVVPSWKDVAEGSAFLDNMYRQRCSPESPSYLFFGYRDDSLVRSSDSSDGVITLKSQLDPRKQFAVQKVYGFDATHVGILNDKESLRVFNQTLELAATSPKRQ